jgi:hypothetical protein
MSWARRSWRRDCRIHKVQEGRGVAVKANAAPDKLAAAFVLNYVVAALNKRSPDQVPRRGG